MRNAIKRNKTVCLCLLMAVLLSIVAVRAEAAGYDANAAVAYASSHWNDGVGVCDQFVKACLNAGGIDIQAGGVDMVRNALIDAGYGTAEELEQDEDSPYISWSRNEHKLSAGDILFFYCSAPGCQKNVHTAIVAGYDDDDHLLAYAHNPEWNSESVVRVYHQGYTQRWTVSVVHIKSGAWSHTHNFSIQGYDEEHPHAMYRACSCGTKYYLGWNAEVSFCPHCNPGYGVKTVDTGNYDVTIPAKTEVANYATPDGYISAGKLPAKEQSYVLNCTEKVTMTNGKLRFGYRYDGDAMRYFIYTKDMSYITHLPAVPAAPQVSAGIINSTGKVQLTWKAVTGAEKYQVYYSTNENFSGAKIFTTTKTSMTHTGAVTGTTYYYKVRAIAADGTASAFGNVVTRTCATVPPQITGSILSTGKIRLTWAAVNGAAKYQVYYSINADFSGAKIFTTTKTSMNHIGAVVGTTYYYKVRAITANEKSSAFSNVRSFTCIPSTPNISGVGYNSTGKPKVTWSAAVGAERYEVYVSTSKNGTYRKLITTSKCSVIHTGASSGRTYFYKIRAISYSTSTFSGFSEVVGIRSK